jgi:hypothetical protein
MSLWGLMKNLGLELTYIGGMLAFHAPPQVLVGNLALSDIWPW